MFINAANNHMYGVKYANTASAIRWTGVHTSFLSSSAVFLNIINIHSAITAMKILKAHASSAHKLSISAVNHDANVIFSLSLLVMYIDYVQIEMQNSGFMSYYIKQHRI